MADRLIRKVAAFESAPDLARGLMLPKSLTFSIIETLSLLAKGPDIVSSWTNYLLLCIMVVQGRSTDMSPEEIAGRVELEATIEQELFGEWLPLEAWNDNRMRDTRRQYRVEGMHSSTIYR